MEPSHRARKYSQKNYTPVDLSELRFAKDKATNRYFQLRKIFIEMTDKPDWMRMDPFITRNFVEEYWIRGPNNEYFSHGVGDGWKEKCGTRWYVLEVMTYKLPDVFGLKVNAGSNPDREGWGVNLSYANMDLMGGISASLSFPKWEGGKIIDRVRPLGHYYEFPEGFRIVEDDLEGGLSETDMIEVHTGESIEQQLSSIFNSERSFKKYALRGHKNLLKLVEGPFVLHSVKRQRFEEYKNDGIPPDYSFEDLRPDEEKDLLEEVRTRINGWSHELKEHSDELYGHLMDLAPWDDIWK